jgi:7-cyano-7-deazaguanine reductase
MHLIIMNILDKSLLGKTAKYPEKYDKTLLFSIPRKNTRQCEVTYLPFRGYDIWHAYEISWLNQKGKPQISLAEIILPYDSPNLIESKSLKLYLNSFNNSKFVSHTEILKIITKDLSEAAEKDVAIRLYTETTAPIITNFINAQNIDDIDTEIDTYSTDKTLLKTHQKIVSESLCSNLLKSNCPVTGQPDWASVLIQYQGKQIDHESLLKYIISFRNYQEFHEECVERMFLDIMEKCVPDTLTVYARYTRRGGLDINPIRTNNPSYKPDNNFRMIRQ